MYHHREKRSKSIGPKPSSVGLYNVIFSSKLISLSSRLSLICIFLLFNNIIVLVNGYSSGAPNNQKVCTTLTPGHGTKQNTPSPYRLALMIDDFVDGADGVGIVGIELSATIQVTFAGFIVQARSLNDPMKIIDGGYFTQTSNNTHTQSCLSNVQNTWTQDNGEPKTKVSTRWRPNSKDFTGSIFFLATVVQVKQAFWDQIKSNPLYFINGKLADEETYLKYEQFQNDNDGKQPEKALSSSSSSGLDYNERCNGKLCLGLGEDSDCFSKKTCHAILSVHRNDAGEHLFNMQAKPTDIENVYYSMGISFDDKMGEDFVVDCFVDSRGRTRIALSYNEGKDNSIATFDEKELLTQTFGQFSDGIVECKWKLKAKFHAKQNDYDLINKNYHILMASGKLENDLGFKEYHDFKVKTPEPINLSSFTGTIQFKDLSFLIQIHGSLMLVTWFGTVPIAMILARYFKNAWQGKLLCGVQIWFAFHRGLMILSLCFIIIAQACIFYYLGEFRIGLHQILGAIAICLAFLQPIGAFFRPHPGTPKRWLFNWAHWFGGNLGHICACAAILFASSLKLANLSDSFLYVAVVWILFHVGLHLLFQFYSFCISDFKTTPDIALQDMHQRQLFERETKTRKNSFQYILLIFYLILMSFLVAILVIFIVFPSLVADLL